MTIDTMHVTTPEDVSPSILPAFVRGWRVWRTWSIRRRTRRALLDLTEEQLRDIGVSRSEARREVGKSFYWD